MELSAEIRDQVLVEWNNTHVTYDSHLCLHELFECEAGLSPNSVTLISDNSEITNIQLNVRVNRLARYLLANGYGRGDLLGIFLERSPEMVIAMLAVLKAGAAYVPLDPDFPEARLTHMLEDADVTLILTSQLVEPRLPLNDRERLFIDCDNFDSYSTENPQCDVNPDDLAYVMYTSGSTGLPKGVMVPHRAIANHLFWMQETFPLGPADRVIQKTPYSFDASLWEIYAPLISCATLVLARHGGHQDMFYLVDLMLKQRITLVKLVPSMLRMLLEIPEFALCKNIRHVFCGGEKLSSEMVASFYLVLPEATLHNMYGPTETAVDVACWTCDPKPGKIVPIGRAVSNTQLYILDDALAPVPLGETGELCIGGIQLALGYLNQLQLTEKLFVANPNSSEGATLFKSGDLARYRADGVIELLGRTDHQVKVNGVRVELEEIECALQSHPSITQAIVVAQSTRSDNIRLVAYVALANEIILDSMELRAHAEVSLPAYLVPHLFIVLDCFPLTSSGKVDRHALPKPDNKRPAVATKYKPPQDNLQRKIAGIWCELLNIDKVGVRDRFFELGGTSILAAMFINRMRTQLAAEIYVVTIFEYPCIEEYAAFLKRDYAKAVSEKFGVRMEGSESIRQRITKTDLAEFGICVPTYIQHSPGEDAGRKNPRALFILAPPRSGTTLLRVMLAGHPHFYSTQELNLLMFNTMGERKAGFSGKFSPWLEGLIRTVMDLKGCDANQAKDIISTYENRACTTKDFYHQLQKWTPHSMLVDKTPAYALDAFALEKAERDFEEPLYLQLTRHPAAMVSSFTSKHLEQILFLNQHDYSARRLAELVWLVSHHNITGFLRQIPQARKCVVQFEEMIRNPESVMRAMCANFELPYHSDLIDPYKNIENKMTDGIYDVSAPMGDTRLLELDAIDPAVADKWAEQSEKMFLSDMTWEMASTLGYKQSGAKDRISGAKTRKNRLAQQRRKRAVYKGADSSE